MIIDPENLQCQSVEQDSSVQWQHPSVEKLRGALDRFKHLSMQTSDLLIFQNLERLTSWLDVLHSEVCSKQDYIAQLTSLIPHVKKQLGLLGSLDSILSEVVSILPAFIEYLEHKLNSNPGSTAPSKSMTPTSELISDTLSPRPVGIPIQPSESRSDQNETQLTGRESSILALLAQLHQHPVSLRQDILSRAKLDGRAQRIGKYLANNLEQVSAADKLVGEACKKWAQELPARRR